MEKGFSLIELVVSLVLTSSVGFFLLEFYGTSQFFFQRTFEQLHASSILDAYEEGLIVKKKVPKPYDEHYELLVSDKEMLSFELNIKKQRMVLTRRYFKFKVGS